VRGHQFEDAGEQVVGAGLGLTVYPDIGDRFQPQLGGGLEVL
jgi:hypothetical protein